MDQESAPTSTGEVGTLEGKKDHQDEDDEEAYEDAVQGDVSDGGGDEQEDGEGRPKAINIEEMVEPKENDAIAAGEVHAKQEAENKELKTQESDT